MAGKRRGTDKPLKRLASCDRRMNRVRDELAAAVTDADRIYVAADYLRGALHRGPAPAGQVDELINDLIATGDRINKTVREEKTRDRK